MACSCIFLLQGLKGSADENHDGVVTLSELTYYANGETKNLRGQQMVSRPAASCAATFRSMRLGTTWKNLSKDAFKMTAKEKTGVTTARSSVVNSSAA